MTVSDAAPLILAEWAQAAWDAYAILGFDTDGDPTPAAVVGWGPDSLREFAREARAGWDEALDEIPLIHATDPLRARIEALEQDGSALNTLNESEYAVQAWFTSRLRAALDETADTTGSDQ